MKTWILVSPIVSVIVIALLMAFHLRTSDRLTAEVDLLRRQATRLIADKQAAIDERDLCDSQLEAQAAAHEACEHELNGIAGVPKD